MPGFRYAAVLAALASLVLGGCCRDTIREMASLKDKPLGATKRSAAAPTEKPSVKSAEAGADDAEGAIETGSIPKPTCQGAHLAYQATREYIKNFGPKPPDLPGEQGACNPAQ